MKSTQALIVILLLSIYGYSQSDTTVGDTIVMDSAKLDTLHAAIADSAVKFDPSKRVGNELNFALYLVTNEQYSDAEFLLHRLAQQPENALERQIDSINYLTGWTEYYSKNFEEAIEHFKLVTPKSELYTQTQFYTSICNVYLTKYDTAKTILNRLELDENPMLWEMRQLQLASIALLERDYDLFDTLSQGFTNSHFQYSSEEQAMLAYHSELSTYKRKSPFIAGLLSAIIPGIGKFYAGYRGLPFGTMYINLPLAAVAVEAAIIAGFVSVPFLVFGAIFGVFYIGNIWGSALSVYAIEKEIYAEIDRNILFDMHIPLRRVFWQ